MKRLERDWIRMLCFLGVLILLGQRYADAQGTYHPVNSEDVVAMKFNHYFKIDQTHHEADFEWSFCRDEFVIKNGRQAIPADLCERLLPNATRSDEIRGTWRVKDGRLFLTDIKYGDKVGNKIVELVIYRTAPTVIRIGEPQYVFAVVMPFEAGGTIVANTKGPTKPYSNPVRAEGVDFEVAAETVWNRPAEVYGKFNPGIALRISNRTDKDLMFDLGGSLRISLRRACSYELVGNQIGEQYFPEPVKVAAGKSETISLPVQLVHTRIHEVCVGVKSDLVSSTNWLTRDIPPGKYRLCLSLENTSNGEDAWMGMMRTETLDIEVGSAK